MYKIGIIGHSPDHFSDRQSVQRTVVRTIDRLGLQYGESEVVFNIAGEIGIGLWASSECLNRIYKYHLFLPYSLEDTCQHWYDDQKSTLDMNFKHAYSLTTCYPNTEWADKSYELLIDDSNFVVCFWTGRKQGKAYDAIRYALRTNKLALHGLDELKLITNIDVKKTSGKRRNKK
ncbi:hypothetical protein LCGC14_1138030 [marine sediment metagenome]|uniref:DUF1273 domain-containing protein n=1 Tax=marine sediment metagenome TaxID=412755 RepID=A0A0F9LZ93_9ZZZZ